MNQEQKSLKIGAAVIVCAIVLRLAGNGVFRPLLQTLERPEVASFLLYMETGRIAKVYQVPEVTEVWLKESPAPELPQNEEIESEPASFSPEDTACLALHTTCDYEPDLETLLLQPLDWNLRSEDPTVLILHTHTTESYTKMPGEDYEESADYRTLDPDYNLLAVGDVLAESLEKGGVSVLHDRTLHDYPSYNGSYEHARASIEAYLSQYPSIQLVLDLHRDAADREDGSQLTTKAVVDGKESAQLMLVVGTDAGGLYHPNWRENLSLALKLQVMLEQKYPGLCRDISLRSSRFNQDESPGALLVEVGAAGDTLQEALVAAEALAQGILTLAGGSVTEDSAG